MKIAGKIKNIFSGGAPCPTTIRGASQNWRAAGDEPCEFTSRGEGGRVPPFIKKFRFFLREQPSFSGFTFVELLVSMGILVFLISSVFLVFSTASRQGINQDRHNIAWHTYGRLISALRDDLKRTIKIEILSPEKMNLKIVSIGDHLEKKISDVSWAKEGMYSVHRKEGWSKLSFDFSGAFLNKEIFFFRLSEIK